MFCIIIICFDIKLFIVELFLTEVFSRHGSPEIIITDNGSSFISEIAKIMVDLYESWIHFVTHHPIKRNDRKQESWNWKNVDVINWKRIGVRHYK